LAKGDAEADESDRPAGRTRYLLWVGVLAALLGVSILLNVVLLLRK
jgi:hypothetical protein